MLWSKERHLIKITGNEQAWRIKLLFTIRLDTFRLNIFIAHSIHVVVGEFLTLFAILWAVKYQHGDWLKWYFFKRNDFKNVSKMSLTPKFIQVMASPENNYFTLTPSRSACTCCLKRSHQKNANLKSNNILAVTL